MIIRAGRSLRSLNTVYYEILNPLHEPDWNDRLSPGMGESIFNSAEWAAVLHESYGYRPCYVTSREADTRSLLIPMMEVDSWLTGRRGVSLPFSDFCAPVGVGSENITSVIQELVSLGRQRNWRYCEIRNDCAVPPEMPRSARYLTHTLDLAPSDAEQFGRLDGSVRTSIRKAVTSGVEVTFSVSLDSMRDFYKLNCETRRRHGLPPQPFRFFRNVHQHIIAKGLGRTVTAWHLGRPIAAAWHNARVSGVEARPVSLGAAAVAGSNNWTNRAKSVLWKVLVEDCSRRLQFMKRVVFFALLAAILAAGTCPAQTEMASDDSRTAVRAGMVPTLLAVAQQAPAAGAPAAQGAGRGAGRGGFGGPIELGPDDKPAFADPPAGFNVKRDNVPHGELTAIEYDSKSLGTRRRMRVYTPPGYSTSRKYPVLYLLHGIGGTDTEWTASCHADNIIDNLLAEGKIQPMVMVFPDGNSARTVPDLAAGGRGAGAGGGGRGGAGGRGMDA